MGTKDIFSTTYRQDYFQGYSNGFNPLLKINNKKSTLAFISGFNSGRMDYEEMNGLVKEGIPEHVVTIKALEDFLLAGLLGLRFEDTKKYTSYQLTIISKWYQSGVEKYDPNQSVYLSSILEESGIQMS